MSLESYFGKYREGIIGIDQSLRTPQGEEVKLVYADWTASGRNYLPIEKRIQEEIMPFVANTHTDTSSTGMAMTHAYHSAQAHIKRHVNAAPDDLIITAGSGMTRMVNKFQRILGLKSSYREQPHIPESERPVVFISHMEHHSNQTSWLETIATVVIIEPTEDGLIDLEKFEGQVSEYADRAMKIASITACSNVTGIRTPYHEAAKIIHRAGGVCFVDFACSAPYVDINMHPGEEGADLDAIFFSPHKFLGGPGSSGVLIFNKKLYFREVPDDVGGGTVDWTNPWGQNKYVDNIEEREDGGTPSFLQTIKAALCVRLKEDMGTEKILQREHELLEILWEKISGIPNVHILASQHKDRLAVISFYITDLHYSMGVRLLNDKFGIQCRGGCSCAGTYGHYLLHVDRETSKKITDLIDQGDFSLKPGWIRVSLSPTMTDREVGFIGDSIRKLAENHAAWVREYDFNPSRNILKCNKGELDQDIVERMDQVLLRKF